MIQEAGAAKEDAVRAMAEQRRELEGKVAAEGMQREGEASRRREAQEEAARLRAELEALRKT